MPKVHNAFKAILCEAYNAAVTLLPPALQRQFVLIGGTLMLVLGSDRRTEDVDVAITAESLHAFEEAAAKDSRFSVDVVRAWSYQCPTTAIVVQFEFLAMNGGFVPKIRAQRPALAGFRAGLGELAIMKANAFESREEPKDLLDFAFTLDLLQKNKDEGFDEIDIEGEDREALNSAAIACGGKYPKLLQSLLGQA